MPVGPVYDLFVYGYLPHHVTDVYCGFGLFTLRFVVVWIASRLIDLPVVRVVI